MTTKHITIVYPITGPDHEEQLLAAGHWIASCHWDAMAERDALQSELERVKADLAAMTEGYEAARLEVESLKKALAEHRETITPSNYAGVIMWAGDYRVARHLSEVEVRNWRLPSNVLSLLANSCLSTLAQHLKQQTQDPK